MSHTKRVLIGLLTVVAVSRANAAGEADSLEQAARPHGEVEGRLETLRREIEELRTSRALGAPLRPWSLEHLLAASGMPEPIRERVRSVREMVEVGLAEEGEGGWCSTVFERAIENEIVTSQEEQERFIEIAGRTRKGVVLRWATWRAVEMALTLTPARGVSAGGMLFSRAPQSAGAALAALNTAVHSTGFQRRYVNVVEAMSARAMRFQELVSGGIRAGTSFLRGGVKFDYFDTTRRVLVEVKGPGYANFVDKTGRFYGWFRGAKALEMQAERQIKAAAGEKVAWVFSEKRAMDATRLAFIRLAPSHPVQMALKSGQLTMRTY
jgi:restriction endonuclease fold toxin 5 of polymorphic toxin system